MTPTTNVSKASANKQTEVEAKIAAEAVAESPELQKIKKNIEKEAEVLNKDRDKQVAADVAKAKAKAKADEDKPKTDVMIKNDVWDENRERIPAGKVISVTVDEAMAGIESGKYTVVKDEE